MHTRPHTILLLALLWASLGAWGAKLPKFKFGEPTAAELSMTTYDKDTTAAAVVLLNLRDVGYRIVGDKIVSVTTDRRRIKILKDAGKDMANVEMVLYYNASRDVGHETLSGVKAVAVNLEGGKEVKTRMKSELVFREKIDATHERVKFTIPQARVGAVIEYEYTIQDDQYYSMADWDAMLSVPVVYARYAAIIPDWLLFNYEMRGMQWIHAVRGEGLIQRNDVIQTTSRTYVMEGSDIPASKGDSFVWCPGDYTARVTAELTATQFPGSPYRDYGQTWNRIDEMLLDDSEFGGRIGDKSPYHDELKAKGVDTIADMRERALTTIVMMQKHLKWNRSYAFWPKAMSKTAKAGTGTNADLNLVLINMLRDVGIKACPVVLRNRRAGQLPIVYPSMEKLTTFVVAIPLSPTQTVYADASGERGFINAMAPILYVNRARLISKDDGEKWVDLQTIAAGNTVNIVKGSIDAQGTLRGECTTQARGQAALTLRNRYAGSKDQKDFVAKREAEDKISITDYQATGIVRFGEEVRERYRLMRKGTVAGDHIYVNPTIFRMMNSNPFTAPTRLLPIEFPYVQAETSTYHLTIPDGWEVEELPKNVSMATPGRELMVRIVCGVSGNTIQINTTYKINQLYFAADHYQAVKTIFDTMAERAGDMIVLKKKP